MGSSKIPNLVKQLQELNQTDRKSITVYISEGVFEEFKKNCAGLPAGQVLELLMLDFNDQMKSKTAEN